MSNVPTTKQVMDNSMSFVMSLSRLWTRRSVRAQGDQEGMTLDYGGDNQVEVKDKKMVHVAKDILVCKELKDIERRDGETRLWIMRRALPSPLLRAGVYLIPLGMVQDVDAYLTDAEKERNKLIEAFVDAYPAKIKEARAKLKDLFNPAEYPAVASVRSQFDMRWSIVQWGPDDKLKSISKALFERERAKIESDWANAAEQIRDALREGMAGMVSHMAAVLTGGEDGKAKRFKESTVKKMDEFLDMFDKRNITNDTELSKLVTTAKKLLSGVDAKALREDDKIRERVTKGISEIKSKLDTMVEVRPARRMTLADEGEVA